MRNFTSDPDKRTRLAREVRTRQLDLLTQPIAARVYGLPVWALFVCWAASGEYPFMGEADLIWSAVWFGLICTASLVVGLVERSYRRHRSNVEKFDPMRWVPLCLASLAAVSASWASLCWFFWIPGNEANQLVLAILVLAGVINGLVARISWFESYFMGTGVAFVLLWSRCLYSETDAAGFLTVILPVVFLVTTLSVRRASKLISENIAAQIENEWLKEENARARDEAEHANRMKSNFLANMSHELRTPLNAVLGFSEIIALQSFGPEASDKYRDYAADIHSSGKHLLSMINGLLDVAKIEAGKLELQSEWFDGGRELHEASRLIAERAAEKGVALEVVVEPGAEQVWCDERAFLQIAINLLSNAVKFTGRGFIRAGLKREAGTVVLYVKDTGCGIPAAQLARVFEAFEQVDNRYTKTNTGTGLGLTLVRALVTLHGGQCRIESVEGTGTTISVTFPLPEAERITPAVPAKSRVA